MSLPDHRDETDCSAEFGSPGTGVVRTRVSVTIAVCTQRRPEQLDGLLDALATRVELSDETPLTEVLVIDNDADRSAEPIVERHRRQLVSPLVYVHEPREGFAFARNSAIRHARGDIMVFIDDDGRPRSEWPRGLVDHMVLTGAAMVGGPVTTDLPEDAPEWVRSGGFFLRDEAHPGTSVTWLRTGNLAIDMAKIRSVDLLFDEAYNASGGEDVAFTRAAVALGLELEWSERGAVIDLVPLERCTTEWLLARERLSASNWARARLATEPGANAAASILVRVAAAGPRALAQWVTGTIRRQAKPALPARLTLARGRGQLEGLLGRDAG